MATPMWDVYIALVFNFLAMATIGIGPSLYFLRGTHRGAAALWIAPAAGFVVASLLGTYLTLLDWPVSRSCPLILLVGVAFSIVLLAAAFLSGDAPRFSLDFREMLWPAGGFLLLCALTAAPQFLGGLKYTILRGNGSDSFNYLTAAGYLDHEPISWASHTDVASLEDRHPSYERAQQLLTSRWTTFVMLAFTARLGGSVPYRFEYFFSIFCFLLAFGPAYLFCRQLLHLGGALSTLAAFAICGGFWAQLIVDLRAESQLNSIPVLLLLAFLVARLETDAETQIWRRELILIAAAAAALFLLYPEILPMVILGVGLFFVIRLWRGQGSAKTLASISVSAFLALAAVLPTWRLLWRFAQSQMHVATMFKNHWEQFYYPWLYSSPLSGIWGFGPFAAPGNWLKAPAIVLGVVLSAVLGASLVWIFLRPSLQPAGILAATLSCAALLQWAYLYTRGQLWAGAKGLSFGYPFLIFSVLALAFTVPGAKSGWRRTCRKVAQAAVLSMLFIEAGLAFYRPVLVRRGLEYGEYIISHGEYRRHDWNLASFASVLNAHPGANVWVDVSNPWVADYISLVFGWNVHLVNVGTSRDIEDFKTPPPNLETPPEYIIVEKSASNGESPEAQNSELALLKAGAKLLVTEIENPNGVEGSPQQPFFWLGTQPVKVSVFSSAAGTARLSGNFTMGPSTAPNLGAIHLSVASDTAPAPHPFTLKPGVQQLPVPVRTGFNRITLQVNDPAVRFLPEDRRPLLVRLDGLRLELEECQPAAAR